MADGTAAFLLQSVRFAQFKCTACTICIHLPINCIQTTATSTHTVLLMSHHQMICLQVKPQVCTQLSRSALVPDSILQRVSASYGTIACD